MTDPIILTASQCKITTAILHLAWLKDDKITALADSFPITGPFVYLAIICQIGEEGGYLPIADLRFTKRRTGVELDVIKDILAECSKPEIDLFEVSDRGITSKRMQREIETLMRKRYSIKKDQEVIFPWSLSPAPIAPPMVNHSLPIVPPKKEEKREERIREETDQEERRKEEETGSEVGVLKFGKYCEISMIDYEMFSSTKGEPFMHRCFEFTNGWVDDTGGDSHEQLKRAKRAKNCTALFNNFVFVRIAQEAASNARASPKPRDFEAERRAQKRQEAIEYGKRKGLM